MRQRTLSLGWVALLSISSVQAQTTGVWNKAFSEASAKSFANAHGYAGVGFSPAIMSIPDKPFTAKRLYSNQRKENVVDVGPPITAECTIARDTQGRVHYEMAFEGVQVFSQRSCFAPRKTGAVSQRHEIPANNAWPGGSPCAYITGSQ
jgi:hypothetical protein